MRCLFSGKTSRRTSSLPKPFCSVKIRVFASTIGPKVLGRGTRCPALHHDEGEVGYSADRCRVEDGVRLHHVGPAIAALDREPVFVDRVHDRRFGIDEPDLVAIRESSRSVDAAHLARSDDHHTHLLHPRLCAEPTPSSS